MFANRMTGDTYGVEAWGNYQVSAVSRLAPIGCTRICISNPAAASSAA